MGWAAFGTLLLGVMGFAFQVFLHRRSEKHRKRTRAPYLQAWNGTVRSMTFRGDRCGKIRITPDLAHILSGHRLEVARGLPPGTRVGMLVVNLGQPMTPPVIESEDEPSLELESNMDDDDTGSLHILTYEFQPAQYGAEQRFRIRFKVKTGGEEGCHVYAIRHGIHYLKRVDPKIP